jgi:hypothetical protein
MSSGASQKFVTPETTFVEGKPSWKRLKSVECKTGNPITINWTMLDKNGDPVNFSDITNATAKAKIRETLSINPTNPGIEIICNIIDATTGRVDIPLNQDVVRYPGVSVVEVAIFNQTGEIVFSNEFWLVINRSQWSSDVVSGPPTIAEIRLHLRDSSPEDNLWRDIEEFDLAEIAACISRPVMYWNESPPPIDLIYNTSNFPFRYNWLNGITACLYQLAARWYRRVHLPYSAGGVSIDDKNKSQEYELIGQKLWEEYKIWVLHKKVQINADSAWGSVSSPYIYRSLF